MHPDSLSDPQASLPPALPSGIQDPQLITNVVPTGPRDVVTIYCPSWSALKDAIIRLGQQA